MTHLLAAVWLLICLIAPVPKSPLPVCKYTGTTQRWDRDLDCGSTAAAGPQNFPNAGPSTPFGGWTMGANRPRTVHSKYRVADVERRMMHSSITACGELKPIQ